MNRDQKIAAIAGAAGLLAIGFGGGYLSAKGVPAGGFLSSLAGAGGGAVGEEAKGQRWFGFGKPRAADARRAPARKPDGFAVWTTRIDTSGAQPLACIRMTRAARSGQVLRRLRAWSRPSSAARRRCACSGDELCIGGVGFVDRRVTLLKGLPAAGRRDPGRPTPTSTSPSATSRPTSASPATGVILPREEADGVGIETVNVSRLDIEVWRVPDRNLVRQQISAAATRPARATMPSDYGDDSPDDEGRVVWKGEVAVKGDPGQRATTVFPLGAVLKEMKPGGYVIKARDASGQAASRPTAMTTTRTPTASPRGPSAG